MMTPLMAKSKKRKWYKKQLWRKRNCKRMKTIRLENFERLSNRVGNRLEFAGEYVVTLIFDEGLDTEARVELYITSDGKATITDAVVKNFGLVQQFLSPKDVRWTTGG